MNLQQVIKKSTYSQSTGGVLLPATASLSEFQYNVSKVQAEGGRLILGPGTFNLTGNITFASTKARPFYLKGQGRYRTIVKFLGDYGFRGSALTHLFMKGMTIAGDCGVEYGTTGFQRTAAIKIDTGTTQIRFSDLFINDSFDTGFQFNDVYQVVIRDSWFECGRGIVCSHVASPASMNSAEQYWITNCQFNADNGIIGIDVSIGGVWHVIGCYFGNYKSSSPAAIAAARFLGCDSVSLSGNHFESNSVNDIILGRASRGGTDYDTGTVYIFDNKFVNSVNAHAFINVDRVVDLVNISNNTVNGDNSMIFISLGANVAKLHLGPTGDSGATAVTLLSGTPTTLFDLARQQLKASHNNWAALSDVVSALVSLGLFDQA